MKIKDVYADLIYCNGDSWACGDELSDSRDQRIKKSFPGLLARDLNLSIVNSAIPGGSNHRTLRSTVEDLSRLLMEGKKPFALITWTFPHRFELYNKKEDKWVDFNNTEADGDMSIGNTIWSKFSTDKSDLLTMLTQVVLMESFLVRNNIPYFMVNIHSVNYRLLTKEEEFRYQSQINPDYYLGGLPLKELLLTYPTVKWGERGHPLEDGHKIVADFLNQHIRLRYNFKM